jgi:hypothetical protein
VNFRRALAFVGLAILGSASLSGQTPQNDRAKDKTAIERLAEQVEALQAQLRHVQEQLAQMSGETAAVPAASSVVASGQEAVKPVEPVPDALVPATDDEGHKLGPFQMRGFSDLGFGRPLFEKMPEAVLKGSAHSFTIGDFDLFTTARISDRLSFLAELLITSDFTNNFGAEIDRMMLNYSVNDYFKIGVGKFNTAIGYYSNAFHRARYFQTATGRPLMFADEDNGGILPVHSIGVTTSGKLPSGPLGLHWVAELANGRASTSLSDPGGEVVDVQNFVDENNTKAVNFALMASPPAWHGFQVGASFYRDRLRPEPLPDMSQQIMSAHVVFVRTNFEILNEAAIVRHAYVGSGHVWKSLTSYTQVSRKFGP